ncbi:MAG TPA: M56 family metallopeptidase [Bryobacteraceae bacterium]|jgi:beta-lactamase regulating signal transducer with metallopeptidase domain|nr:M56 family metallopeptidase [Bryobacteraceae bacterium]
MTNSAGWAGQWIHAETVYALGLTLGHFLWEGAALALLLFSVVKFFRSAHARYSLAVATLAAMLVSPIVTFLILSQPSATKTLIPDVSLIARAAEVVPAVVTRVEHSADITPSSEATWPAWFVCVWLGGVLLLSMRTFGGWLVLRRLQREGAEPLPADLVQKCRKLEQRLGLKRRILYLRSRIVDAPSAMGWLRPVVLVPVCALSGLSAEQLEAVIVHELAHIRRLDCVINLVQIAAETLLFYHPAIWWVNRVIRNERENCCDDVSVEICGNATEYARALTILESARTTPTWVLSATGGVLKSRVMRLLGSQSAVAAVSSRGLAFFGIFCATGVLLASAAVTRAEWHPAGSAVSPKLAAQTTGATSAAPVADPEVPALAPSPDIHQPINSDPPGEIAQAAPAPPARSSVSTRTSGDSYLEGLNAAGLKDLTVDEVIALKIQGVTPEYVREMRSNGFDPSTHDLIAMKVQDITPDYVKQIRATGLNPNIQDLISMKVQGITPAYVRDMQSAGLKDMQVHDLISMKVQGIDPEYVRTIRATGLNPNLHEFVSLKVQNVTAEYIRALNSAGLGDLRVHDYISAKVQDVTPEFIEKVRSHGFKNLTLHQLIALKNAEVF